MPTCGNVLLQEESVFQRPTGRTVPAQCAALPQRQRLNTTNLLTPVRCTPPFSSRLRDFHSFPSFTISCSWAASPTRVAGARPRRPLEGLGAVEGISGELGPKMGLNPFAQAFIPARTSPRPQASASGALPASTSLKTAGATADAAEAPVFPLLGLPREVRAGSRDIASLGPHALRLVNRRVLQASCSRLLATVGRALEGLSLTFASALFPRPLRSSPLSFHFSAAHVTFLIV